jgi:hypothetical protein
MNANPAPANPTDPLDWMNFWIKHPRILFQRTFGAGGLNFLDSAKAPGVFDVTPRFDEKKRLVGYAVVSNGKKLPVTWSGVSLAPMGTTPAAAVGGPLPPFEDTLMIKKLYEDTLSPVVTALSSDTTDLQRLEGFFPVYDDTTGTFNIDRIRIVNITGLVKKVDGNLQDLSLAILTLMAGTAGRQNGGGNGPPDP